MKCRSWYLICIFIKAEPNPAKLCRIKISLVFDPACASSGNISFPSAKLDGIKSHLKRSKICTGWGSDGELSLEAEGC